MYQWYIKLRRSSADNKLYFAEPFTKWQAWQDLILFANHSDGSFFIRWIEVPLTRGQIAWSELTMSKRWKWSRDKVRRYLSALVRASQIRQQKSHETTVITILNYDTYQWDNTTNNTTNDTTEKQQKNNKQYINNNDKNVEEWKEESTHGNKFIPPTLDDVVEYCRERWNNIDPEGFIAYYTANGRVQSSGRKIKDRKSCVITWEKKDKQRQKQLEPQTMQEFADLYNKIWVQEFTKRYGVDKARETKLYMF